MKDRVYLYDTTLRDGAQTQGVDFSVQDKLVLAGALDGLGIDYIEAGWPGANPTDDALFKSPPPLKYSKLVAFGMTRRSGKAEDDQGLQRVVEAQAAGTCLVGKAWDFQVTDALGITLEENLQRITDSIAYAATYQKDIIFDAEHFFDGYRANAGYALEALKAANNVTIPADKKLWLVLCDTNGGMLPDDITDIVTAVKQALPNANLGIHCHNDAETAVANSLAGVQAGVRLVHGTLNGLGERCGNANLVSIIPALVLKMGFEVGIDAAQLKNLTHISRLLDERLSRSPYRQAPYVGESAFAHKGGLHVSAVAKNPSTYEHIDPALVGNKRQVIVSDQAGRANIISRLQDVGIDVDHADKTVINRLVELVKQREFEGYAYDSASASFELLARRHLGEVPEFYQLHSFRVIDERRWNAKHELINLSEATVKASVTDDTGQDRSRMSVAEGNGPVNALDTALRKVLLDHYPVLSQIELMDYKVRILTPGQGTKAVTRVIIDSKDRVTGQSWATVGVSANVIDASYNALQDSILWRLLREQSIPT